MFNMFLKSSTVENASINADLSVYFAIGAWVLVACAITVMYLKSRRDYMN